MTNPSLDDVRSAVAWLKSQIEVHERILSGYFVPVSEGSGNLLKQELSHEKVIHEVLQSLLDASGELPEERECSQKAYSENICGECSGDGFNSALYLCRLAYLKQVGRVGELERALHAMIEWHPRITQRIGSEGSEARYIQAHQEDAIKDAKKLLSGGCEDDKTK
jgi:hypothetical protein